KYTLNMDQAADEVENAVKTVLENGYRTADIHQDGMKKVGCMEMGRLIVEEISKSKVS
ncbi:MAG: isocitrate/isopropylmalate family dehydrogenase, partial [Thermodesulfobacteriota bacterium]